MSVYLEGLDVVFEEGLHKLGTHKPLDIKQQVEALLVGTEGIRQRER